MSQEIDIPKWDPALEGLINEEYKKLGHGLTLDDFINLGKEYSIRFDDIMVTVFELCFNNLWQYEDEQNKVVKLDREDINQLFVNKRIKEDDMRHFLGRWSPA